MAGLRRRRPTAPSDDQPDAGDDQPPEVHRAGRRRGATASARRLRRSSSRPGRALSAVRVAPLSAHGCSRSSARDERRRVDGARWRGRRPARRRRTTLDEATSSATSVASSRSEAAISLKPKSISHTSPSSSRKMLASRRSRWAMRCCRSCADQPPDRGEHVVGDLGRVEPIERPALDRVVGEDVAVRARRWRTPAGAACARRGRGGEGDERLVLDGAAQRGERPLVAEVVGLEPPVEAEQQVGAALVVAERLDEQLRRRRWRRRSTASIRGRRRRPLELAQRQPDCGEPVDDGWAVGRRDGAPSDDEHGGAAQPADDGGRSRRRTTPASEEGETTTARSSGPAGPPPAPAQPRRGGGEHRGDRADPGAVGSRRR